MLSFLYTSLLVAVAELGDKTQLLVLSLAARHSLSRVLTGIFLAILLLQLMAVTVGQVLNSLIPMQYLQVAVGLSFVGFGIWMLRKEDDEHEEGVKDGRRGAAAVILTVALTFFLAELGDKTQLATISLAARYDSFAGVWLGSSLGLFAADAAAALVGLFAGKRLPQDKIRYVSAAVFVVFGVVTLAEALF